MVCLDDNMFTIDILVESFASKDNHALSLSEHNFVVCRSLL